MRVAISAVFLFVYAGSARGADVLVSSLGTDEVLRYDAASGAYLGVFVSAASGGLDQPHAILERCDDVLVASFGTDNILRYDRITGAFLDEWAGAASGLDAPTYMLYGPDGNVYVSSQESDEILRYAFDGTFIDAFVTAGSGGLDGPSGFGFGPDGRLYVAGRYSANVLAYDGATGAFAEVMADGGDGLTSGDTFGLVFGDNDDLYFVSNSSVYRYDLDTSAVLTTIPLGSPIGLEAGSVGGVYVATANNLRRIDTADDSIGAPLLSGGSISTLNFFRFPSSDPAPDCFAEGVPAASTWGMSVLTLLVLASASVMLRRPGQSSTFPR